MEISRSSGILLHPSSLPGPYGIGDFGPEAYRWIDFVAASGCAYWQILPLGPTGFGDSPYQSFSSFAGNPLFISPELLVEEELLGEEDLSEQPAFPQEKVDFAQIKRWKNEILGKAFRRFADNDAVAKDMVKFLGEESEWLSDFTLFRAIKRKHGGVAWMDWPVPLRDRNPQALKEAEQSLEEDIAYYAFGQFLFFRQWDKLRTYATEKGVTIIGDLPIYAAQDSADVWARRDLFHLDKEGKPTKVSGVPPDYFSETGQLWGNPLYRWEDHADDGFSWWLDRVKASLKMVDILRLDHFRGFADYWSVPAGETTAVNGRWEQGPGEAFFQALEAELGGLPIIAEDLGELSPAVSVLRDQFSLPGMKILQFAFVDDLEHEFLPHNYPENCVAYSGTHDNDTTRGWFDKAPDEERAFCMDYLDVKGGDIAWDFICAIWDSAAKLAIAPMQDFLNLGTEARMNYPSSAQGNWSWRMPDDTLYSSLARRIAELNTKHARLNSHL